MGSKRKVLLGLTTTKGSDWKGKTEEIDKLGIKELALFPTCLSLLEREELYKKLESTEIREIPHVHAMIEFKESELDYLVNRFQTKRFNLHPRPETFVFQKSKYWSSIYVENLHFYRAPDKKSLFSQEAFEKYSVAGICLDFSHLENERRILPENYADTVKLLEKYPIGCNHISGISDEPSDENLLGLMLYDTHYLKQLSQLDYLRKMPLKFFSDYVSIELENSFKKQIEIKEYIEKIISNLEK